MNINTKYKIEERAVHKTLDIIRLWGYGPAIDLAYEKGKYVLNKDPESILCVMLLAWSHNLLDDARKSDSKWAADDLRLLSSFYRKVAHKIYWHQFENNQIGELSDFIRQV